VSLLYKQTTAYSGWFVAGKLSVRAI